MAYNLLHTPEGVRDVIGEACVKKHETINKMMDLIMSYGYNRMDTPGFEYIDTYAREDAISSTNDLYKFMDRSGNILSLRPDFTPSVARAAARYFSHDSNPLKICYQGNVYRNHATLKGRLHETTQLGAELIGDFSPKADAEILSIACKCILESGIRDFKICLGHSGIFKGLLKACGLDKKDIKKLTNLIQNKSYFGMIDLLRKKEVSENLIGIFKKCVGIYEDEADIISLIETIDSYKDEEDFYQSIIEVKDSLDYLLKLINILESRDIKDYIFLDLGLIPAYDYYSGIIFYTYSPGAGGAILSGGRYDNLLSGFGKDAPAIGFAVYCDELLKAKDTGDTKNDYLTVALGKGRLADKAFALFEKLGISPDDYQPDSRKLIVTDEKNKIRFFFAKGPDVPTYVEHGVADLGIVGKDTILEENRDVFEVLDLGFGKCKMCICGKPEAKELIGGPNLIRVASKYPAIAKNYFNNELHQDAQIIKLNGSIELAPILSLTDVIVDIVETGSTLRENGLVVLEEICNLSARIIVNPVTMRLEHERLRTIIREIRKLIEND